VFNAKDLAAFRAHLQQRQAALQTLEQTSNEAADTVELDQSRMGRLSRMDALQGQAMSKEAQRRRELELRRIAGALARIESGDYGLCVRCEEPIAIKRLQHDPAATLCIECANRSESAGQ
jgi:DnaK suppressor protein